MSNHNNNNKDEEEEEDDDKITRPGSKMVRIFKAQNDINVSGHIFTNVTIAWLCLCLCLCLCPCLSLVIFLSMKVSPTAAIVVGLVAGLVAYTAKGWKEVTGFFSFFLFSFTLLDGCFHLSFHLYTCINL